MAISRELILEPADIDRVSIQCASCGTEVGVNLSGSSNASKGSPEIPAECPSCGLRWQELHHAIQAFSGTLRELKKYPVRFRVPEPEPREG
jgi:hypothetical protein